MISVIISTCRSAYLTSLKKNIESTIGIPYEIIDIDNLNEMGICEAYNRGSQKAKYDILCFTHEDIEIKTNNWGGKVLEIFNNNREIGLLGVAGNVYKTVSPSHWSFPGANGSSFFVNVLHGNNYGEEAPVPFFSNPKKSLLQNVAAIDGVWFCAPKKVVREFPFDDTTCTGFHGYDVDYSLTVHQKYKVAVTFEVLIQHFSTGNFTKSWIDEIIEVHKKWKDKLPLLIESFNGFNQEEEEKKAMIFFMKKMVDYDYSVAEILKNFRFQNKIFRFSLKAYLSVLRCIIRYKYFNKEKRCSNENQMKPLEQ